MPKRTNNIYLAIYETKARLERAKRELDILRQAAILLADGKEELEEGERELTGPVDEDSKGGSG